MTNETGKPVLVRDRGDIVIPKDIRKDLGIKPGDFLWLQVEDGMIKISKAVVSPEKFK